ncbi:hypothetical protein [Maridesulfovibrio sp.]|uniref:hypothetical protein n=1 Tax=Maridesulfovibrio sp. TaxID=2795000 RepID=UPI002AA7B4AC|nr:hypothetical protein [Maridesulfovibrio sp.]
MHSLSHPKDLPWVTWLLSILVDSANGSSEEIYAAAEQQGIISVHSSGLWKVDKDWCAGIPNLVSAEKHLDTPKNVALFVMAVGEFSACCNGFPLESCKGIFKGSKGAREIDNVFDLIGKLATEHYPQQEVCIEFLGHSQRVNSCSWDYESYRDIAWYDDYQPFFKVMNRWGLSRGICLLAKSDLKSFGCWLSRQNDPAIICSVMYSVMQFAFFIDRELVYSLLKTSHPFLQLLGVVYSHYYIRTQDNLEWKLSLDEALDIAKSAEINIEDVAWTSFQRLADIYCAKNNVRKQITECIVRGVSKKRICELEEYGAKLQSLFDESLCLLASYYPDGGLSSERVQYLIKVSMADYELPLLLAEKLSSEQRKTLLQAIIKKFHEECGFFDGFDESKNYTRPYQWREHSSVAAKAFVLLHERENIGKKFGSLFMKSEKVFLPYSRQPYLFVRDYSCWAHVFGKLGMMYLYAFKVVFEAGQLGCAEGVDYLREYVFKQSLKLLKFYKGEWCFHSIFDSLSQRSAHELSNIDNSTILGMVNDFVQYRRGYPIARLNFLWVNFDIFEGNRELAFELLNEFSLTESMKRQRDVNFSGYINVVDMALALFAQNDDEVAMKHILKSWQCFYDRWDGENKEDWRDVPARVAKALQGDPVALEWIFTDNRYKDSVSRKVCEER